MNTTTTVPDWDWSALAASLDEHGYAVTPQIFSAADCAELVTLYDRPQPWQSTVESDPYRFGPGEYQYFGSPLPESVAQLRQGCFRPLAEIANTWQERLHLLERFPGDLHEYLAVCHDAGQTQSTPLMLRHGPGDYNSLRQDTFGEHVFPLQLMVALSRPGKDHTGGEFLLVENLPRAKTRGRVVTLKQGQSVIWPTRLRPGLGNRGHYRIGVRYGISTVHTGTMYALGVTFHDAERPTRRIDRPGDTR
jgi:hypothetical protein